MKDYYKVARKTFYEVMSAFGLEADQKDGHNGLIVNVKGDPIELVAGLTHLQLNLFRAALNLHVAVASNDNDEFYHIKNYHEMMQKVLRDEVEEIIRQHADGEAYSTITLIN